MAKSHRLCNNFCSNHLPVLFSDISPEMITQETVLTAVCCKDRNNFTAEPAFLLSPARFLASLRRMLSYFLITMKIE